MPHTSTPRVAILFDMRRADARHDAPVCVVSACYGSRGDVEPGIAIANAAARAWLNVRVVVLVNPFYANMCDDGVDVVHVGDAQEYQSRMSSGAARGGALVSYWLSHLDAHWRALLCVLGDAKRVVVLGNALDFVVRFLEEFHASGLMEHACDVTCCTIVLSPAFVRQSGQKTPPVAVAGCLPKCLWLTAADCLVDCAFVPELDAFRARIGLHQKVSRVFRDWFMSSRVLCLYPAWFERADEPKARIPRGVHQFDFPLAASPGDAHDDNVVRDIMQQLFTDDQQRMVVFVSATGNPPFATRFFAAALASMRALVGSSVKAIVLTKHPDRLGGDSPSNVKHVSFVNLTALLSARKHPILVHHGGIGCCAAGMRAGASHVVVPAAFDQPYNAEILQRMGIARVIPMHKLTTKRLTRALRHALRHEPSNVVSRRADEVFRAYASQASDTAKDVAEFIGRDLLRFA